MRQSIYGKKTLRLAFEFGVILSETAKGLDIPLTPELIEEAEETVIRELKENGLSKTATGFVPLLMTMLVKDEVKK